MRKILLGTTAVVGAALIGMGAAQAQTAPTVRVGGFMFGMYNYIDDDLEKAVPGGGVANAGRWRARSTTSATSWKCTCSSPARRPTACPTAA
jgi:hypothetical protein